MQSIKRYIKICQSMTYIELMYLPIYKKIYKKNAAECQRIWEHSWHSLSMLKSGKTNPKHEITGKVWRNMYMFIEICQTYQKYSKYSKVDKHAK